MKTLSKVKVTMLTFAIVFLSMTAFAPKPILAADTYTYDSASKTLTIHESRGTSDFQAYNAGNHVEVVSIVIDQGVKTISNMNALNKVTSVTIPDSVTLISTSTFQDLTSLTSIKIPNSVTTLGSSAFNGCSNLSQVTLSTGLKSIDGGAFKSCTSLTSIDIPANVEMISNEVFLGCSSLRSVNLNSAKVPTIYNRTFEGMPANFKVYVPYGTKGTLDAYKSAAEWSNIKDHLMYKTHTCVPGEWIIDTPASTMAAGSQHKECTLCFESVEKAEIPMIVEATAHFASGNYAFTVTNDKKGSETVMLNGFARNKFAAKVTVDKTVTYKDTTYKITEIRAKAFYNIRKVKQINIGNNVTKIGKRAFYGCTNLTDVVIGNKVTEISDFAFYKCTSLKKVTIGTGLKKLGSHNFCHDKKLTNLTIKSKKLTKVGSHNIYKTTNLKIKVPSAKVKAYTKLFKNQGVKKVNITK